MKGSPSLKDESKGIAMQLSNVKSVIVGAVAGVAVIAITGAASGAGVGAVFNLGKINKVNGTSILTGSTKNPMLSVINSGSGTAMSLQVKAGRAPLSVNSAVQVPKLNASLLGGLAASQFVQGAGHSRSFGFAISPTSDTQKKLLSVPGFGTFTAFCSPDGGGLAEVTFLTGAHTIDDFQTAITSQPPDGVGSISLDPNSNLLLGRVTGTGVSALAERDILRYATGSGASLTTHMASIDLFLDVEGTTCDFDATAVTSVTGQ